MEVNRGLCSHRTLPVEIDERILLSGLDSGWPLPCQQCQAEEEVPQQADGAASPQHADPSRGREEPFRGTWGPSVDRSQSLERPFTLMSHDPSAGPIPNWEGRAGCPPTNHNPRLHHHTRDSPAAFHQQVHNGSDPKWPPMPSGRIHQVSVTRSLPGGPDARGGVRVKTVSLPEECRKVFITYSVDTARDMIPFTKFLTDQGFRPAIDIFDNAIRRLDVTKWMDSFLKDKSVLIIMAVSPRYKDDVEGVGDEEHGLHTKYIHNQLQNEFIQQGCLNFRLLPVLFQNATKRHVPHWLHSTRIYSWPRDAEDLLLRLLREERYILPQQDTHLTITVRPL